MLVFCVPYVTENHGLCPACDRNSLVYVPESEIYGEVLCFVTVLCPQGYVFSVIIIAWAVLEIVNSHSVHNIPEILGEKVTR